MFQQRVQHSWFGRAWLDSLLETLNLDLWTLVWIGVVGLVLGAACAVSPLAGAGLVIMIAAGCLALSRPIVVCYAVIPAIVLTAGMPRGRLVPMFQIYELVLIGATAVTILVVMLSKRRKPFPAPVMAAVLILVIGTAFLPLFAYFGRGYKLTTSDIFGLMAPLKHFLLFLVFVFLPDSDQDRNRLVQWMILWGSVVAVVGLLQGFHVAAITRMLNQFYPSDQASDAADLGRVTSLLRAWNSLGTFLMLNVALIVALAANKQPRLYMLNMLSALALNGACLLASGSYAGLGGLFASIVILKLLDRRGLRLLIYLAIGLAIATLVLFPLISTRLAYQTRQGGAVPETFSYRLEVWTKIYLPLIQKNFLWGIAPTFANVTWQWAESQYLFLMFRSGIFSLLAHVAWVGILLVWLRRRMRTSEGLIFVLVITVFALLIVLSVMGFTNEVFTLAGPTEYLWILLGLIAGSETYARQVAK